MNGRTYTPELKAQVIADWLAGSSQLSLVRRYNVPRATIQRWTLAYERALPVTKADEREELGALIYEFLIVGFRALIAQARAAGQPEFAARCDESWHQRFGTLADKVLIVAGAVQRGGRAIELADSSSDRASEEESP